MKKKLIILFLIISCQFSFGQSDSIAKFRLNFKFDNSFGKKEIYFLSGPGQSFKNCTHRYWEVSEGSETITQIRGDFHYELGTEETIILVVSLNLDNKLISKDIIRANFFIQLVGLYPDIIDSEEAINSYILETKLDPKKPFVRHEFKGGEVVTEYFPDYVISNNHDFASNLINGITIWTKTEYKN